MVKGCWFLCSDYWDVLKEIQNLRKCSTRTLRYMQGNADSFGGNLSSHLRFSYFDHQNDSREVPCGFLKKFPISDYGQFLSHPSFSLCVHEWNDVDSWRYLNSSNVRNKYWNYMLIFLISPLITLWCSQVYLPVRWSTFSCYIFFTLNADRISMEKCESVVVVSAIFNDHDKIRQPRGLGSQTLQNVCFFMFIDDITLKGLEYHGLISTKSSEYKIGVWRIVKVSKENLYQNPAMNGVIPKYLVHRLFPNSQFSIWIDAKLQLMVDPLLLIHSLVISQNADMAISKHPYFVHTMEEAMATARWKKWWDVNALKMQMEIYCENGLQPWSPGKLPYASGNCILFWLNGSSINELILCATAYLYFRLVRNYYICVLRLLL